MKAIYSIVISLILVTGARSQAGSLDLIVSVVDAESNVGQVIVSLFNAENYLQNPTAQLIGLVDDNGKSVLVFRGLAPGEYAVSVIYDEDMDGELDTGLFRIPREKIGFSNNASARMGPAAFQDASFQLTSPETVISITLGSAR